MHSGIAVEFVIKSRIFERKDHFDWLKQKDDALQHLNGRLCLGVSGMPQLGHSSP